MNACRNLWLQIAVYNCPQAFPSISVVAGEWRHYCVAIKAM